MKIRKVRKVISNASKGHTSDSVWCEANKGNIRKTLSSEEKLGKVRKVNQNAHYAQDLDSLFGLGKLKKKCTEK